MQERVLLAYLSEVFPLEFVVYHDTMRYKELFSGSQKGEITRYRRRGLKERFVRRRLAKLKHLRPTIKRRRVEKAAFHLRRCRLLHGEEVRFLDACKEARLFRQTNTKNLPSFIERVSGIEALPVLRQPQCVKFLNYLFTVILRLFK